MSDKTLALKVVSPTRTVFEGDVSSIVLPAWDGQVGILPGHAPLMTLLGSGMLRAERAGGAGKESFFLSRGVAKVENDRVTVLSEYAGAEPPAGFSARDAMLDLEENDE